MFRLVTTAQTVRPQNVLTQKHSNHVTLHLPYDTMLDLTSILASTWTSCHTKRDSRPGLLHYAQGSIRQIWVASTLDVPGGVYVHCQKKTWISMPCALI